MAASNRRPGSRKRRKDRFIDELAKSGNVTMSCHTIDAARSMVYRWRDEDSAFRAAWDEALEEATDLLEAEAHRRAYAGYEEPVFYQGAECGLVRKYSDTLLIFILKGLRPEKYRERSDARLSGADGGPIGIRDMSDIERANRLATILADAAQSTLPSDPESEA